MSDDASSRTKPSLVERPSRMPRSVIVECDYDEPPEKVWRALTKTELVAAWLLPNDLRPQQGAHFTLKPERKGEKDIACEVLASEPPRLLRYSWRETVTDGDLVERRLDSVVTFLLTENEAGGTHLRLIHSGEEEEVRHPRGVEMCARAQDWPHWPNAIFRYAPRRRQRLRPRTRRLTPIMMVARSARPATQRIARWAA
jgi:uncharacterized protein YndB with AHSA1/START domain